MTVMHVINVWGCVEIFPKFDSSLQQDGPRVAVKCQYFYTPYQFSNLAVLVPLVHHFHTTIKKKLT